MATNVTEWIKHVAARAPFCPDPVIEQEVVNVCRDFCKKTLLWDENELTAIDIVEDVHTYDLASADGDIVAIDYVMVDEVPIDPVSVNELNKRSARRTRQWRDLTASRSLEYIVGMTDEIRLVYIPSESITGGLNIWVCLKPLITATDVPDFLYRDYERDITNGVSGRLMEIPNMPWSNLEQSIYFIDKYEDARDSAMSLKFTGRTRLELIATPVFFA